MEMWTTADTNGRGFFVETYIRDRTVQPERESLGGFSDEIWELFALALKTCVSDYDLNEKLCTKPPHELTYLSGIEVWKEEQYFNDGSTAVRIRDIYDTESGPDAALTLDAVDDLLQLMSSAGITGNK